MPEPQTVVIKVGMHCEGCRKKVKKALLKVPGIEELKVDLKEQKVTIRGNVDVKKVMSKIARTGKANEIVQQPATDSNKQKEAPAGTAPPSAPAAIATTTPTPPRAPASLATTEAATKEAILKDIQMKPLVWIDAPDFLSDDNPNACSVM